ncbi:MAG TPA: HutP family protein [Desulfosporosinus sp.]|nr:HutP family protein [Desulfosporosinus sp.]
MGSEILSKVSGISLGRAAMMLAMTTDREEEESMKDYLKSKGMSNVVVTEVTGLFDEYRQKVIKSAVSAALSTKIIRNDPRQIHAVVHATVEANQGVLIAHLENPSIKMKLGIASANGWIVVAMFGVTALTIATNHERAGLGIMHI